MGHTAEDLRREIAAWDACAEMRAKPMTLGEFMEERARWPPLRLHIDGLLDGIDRAGAGGQYLGNVDVLTLLYELLKSWAANTVGFNAGEERYIPGGYDIMLDRIAERLRL